MECTWSEVSLLPYSSVEAATNLGDGTGPDSPSATPSAPSTGLPSTVSPSNTMFFGQ